MIITKLGCVGVWACVQQYIATATMFGFDNSQISEETPQDSSRSDLQELNNLRQMLPEPINRLDEYLIRQQMEDQSSDTSSIDEEGEAMLLKITQQGQSILELQEKLYYYRSECMRLIDQNQQIKENFKQLEQAAAHREDLFLEVQRKLEEEYLRVSELQKENRKQEEKIKELRTALQKATDKKDKEISFRNTYNQELLSKELLLQQKIILQLTTKNEKMLRINAMLENELRLAEEKLIHFEIDVQQKMCSILVQNVSRLKENHNYNKSTNNYSLTQTNSIPKVNFTSNKPIEQNKTIKLQNSQQFMSNNDPLHYGKELKTIEKDKILRTMDYEYDYKLEPVPSPKPQRKSNRIHSFNIKKEPRQQKYKQSVKYNF